MKALEILFWLLAASAIYSTLLYPILMMILSRLIRPLFRRSPNCPKVSVIISAHNEEKTIEAKLHNALETDYPLEQLEIIVASDGSTDRTDAIVRSFADRRVRLIREDGQRGKTALLNRAAVEASGDILAFSDATGMWNRSAVHAMVSHYADDRVGCVSGRVGYTYDQSTTARGFGFFNRYELRLSRAEGTFGTGSNASGSIHSIRRSVFRPGPPDTFMDMIDPLHTAMQGYRTTFAPDAVSMEESRTRTRDEFRARLRIATRSWRFLVYAIPRLPILKSPLYCFQLFSHKILRWLIGPSLPLMLVLSALLGVERKWKPPPGGIGLRCSEN